MILFIDMDEVLVDFTGGACKIHGITRKQLEELRQPGQWDIVAAMGLSNQEFWDPINQAGEEFWAELDPLWWAYPLMRAAKEICDEIYLLSSPSWGAHSYGGKIKWISQYLPDCNYIITEHKSLLARPGRLLIDDREENVDQFIANDGDGIKFPSMGNSKHTFASDPLPSVLHRLNQFSKESQCI